MNRIPCMAIAALLTSSAASYAGPVLVGTFDFDAYDVVVPGGTRVGFALQLLDEFSVFREPPLGATRIDGRLQPDVFWDDGASGVLEFTPTENPEFAAFAGLVTDGVDDSLLVHWYWEDDGGYAGWGLLESQTFGLESDLVGNSLELIRLTVHEASLEPLDGGLLSATVHVTYDFLGSPIPEPATSLLFSAAGTTLLLRRSIR